MRGAFSGEKSVQWYMDQCDSRQTCINLYWFKQAQARKDRLRLDTFKQAQARKDRLRLDTSGRVPLVQPTVDTSQQLPTCGDTTQLW